MRTVNRNQPRRQLGADESGLVAIMVTLIVMGLLTLVTIGFSRLMLREQRQAIDRQLGAQAFYAAESGINDAIKSGIAIKDDCTQLEISGAPIDNELSANDLVSYSCVTVDAGGSDIVFDSIATSESTVFPINAGNIDQLTFSWQDVDDNAVFEDGSTFPLFPSINNWGANTGMLRVTIIPVPAASFDRATMKNLARTYYLYPSVTAGGSVAYSSGGDIAPGYYTSGATSSGDVISGQCTPGGTPRMCNVTVTNLATSSAASYYVRIKAIYRDIKVAIKGKDAGGSDIALPGAQYVIDSTGKANDVLKRIQVRIPLTSSFSWPEYTVDSAASICKRLIVNPASSTNADCREIFPVDPPAEMNSDPLGLD